MYLVEEVFSYKNKNIHLITMENKNKVQAKLLNLGGTLVQLLVPDKYGNIENIVLTHKNRKDYIKNPSCFGATLGRTAGRIAKGTFTLDGETYFLKKNFGEHHIHGGYEGFSFQVWDTKIKSDDHQNIVEFSYISRHGEENYPGRLEVKVRYILTDENQLIIEYAASSHQATLCNLSNHSYFNLSGNAKRKITHQYLRLAADYFLELDPDLIPTGRWIPVDNTPMDFREGKRIGRDMEKDHPQLSIAKGYDHPWILRDPEDQIQMWDTTSGRRMNISTSYPSVVVYSFNSPHNEVLWHGNTASIHDGICFETQYEPDGIHHEHLHSAILQPREEYFHRTQYTFSWG